VTSGSPSTRRSVLTPTPTSVATSRWSCPACRRTCIACRVSMAISPSLAAWCSECLRRRGQLRAASISGKGTVRIYGTRSSHARTCPARTSAILSDGRRLRTSVAAPISVTPQIKSQVGSGTLMVDRSPFARPPAINAETAALVIIWVSCLGRVQAALQRPASAEGRANSTFPHSVSGRSFQSGDVPLTVEI